MCGRDRDHPACMTSSDGRGVVSMANISWCGHHCYIQEIVASRHKRKIRLIHLRLYCKIGMDSIYVFGIHHLGIRKPEKTYVLKY